MKRFRCTYERLIPNDDIEKMEWEEVSFDFILTAKQWVGEGGLSQFEVAVKRAMLKIISQCGRVNAWFRNEKVLERVR